MSLPTRYRRNPYTEPKGKTNVTRWVARLALLFIGLTSCLTASFILYTRWQEAQAGGRIIIEGGSPDLNPVERLYLQTILVNNAAELNDPASGAMTPAQFVVTSGQGASDIAAALQAANLLDNPDLFLNYIRYYGLDNQLEAGEYTLTPPLTIPQLAQTLTRAIAQDIELRFLEGWRLEEMAHYLATVQPANIDSEQFLALAQRRAPLDLTPYDYLASLPTTSTLEGFLYPDTYRIPTDADAAYLLSLMLQTFGERVTPAMRQAFGLQGLTVYEAVILASIVERETPQVQERPLVAGVYLNRLQQAMLLQADPTVQYAVGYQPDSGSWWKNPLFLVDLALDSPYNTYVYPGLPPGPIANPSLTSLQGVADPVQTTFLFFVADCSNSTPGAHLFSETYAEHEAKVALCR
ncbi:MAG: endolytic transglycosylase MltG [Chloroflexi bacterium]|nr:endolytic transglycosylase MltG [Chloroflexota bacterium]MBP8056427.1 endolytic transglycosylase MltG [Chloroflexota bacterium]